MDFFFPLTPLNPLFTKRFLYYENFRNDFFRNTTFSHFDYRKPAESRKKSEIPHVYGNRHASQKLKKTPRSVEGERGVRVVFQLNVVFYNGQKFPNNVLNSSGEINSARSFLFHQCHRICSIQKRNVLARHILDIW